MRGMQPPASRRWQRGSRTPPPPRTTRRTWKKKNSLEVPRSTPQHRVLFVAKKLPARSSSPASCRAPVARFFRCKRTPLGTARHSARGSRLRKNTPGRRRRAPCNFRRIGVSRSRADPGRRELRRDSRTLLHRNTLVCRKTGEQFPGRPRNSVLVGTPFRSWKWSQWDRSALGCRISRLRSTSRWHVRWNYCTSQRGKCEGSRSAPCSNIPGGRGRGPRTAPRKRTPGDNQCQTKPESLQGRTSRRHRCTARCNRSFSAPARPRSTRRGRVSVRSSSRCSNSRAGTRMPRRRCRQDTPIQLRMAHTRLWRIRRRPLARN